MSIYKKLLEIQKAVKGLSKDKKSNNYEYVTGNKLLSFIRPLMDEHGLLLKQEVLSIDNDRMDYKTGIGTKWEKPKSEILSKVMMRFTWVCAETGEKDENLFGANGQNDWEKGLGSALTYAERYFILKYFHIATDEDDIDNPSRKPQEIEQPKKQSKERITLTKMQGKEMSKEWLKAVQYITTGKVKDIARLERQLIISDDLKVELQSLINSVNK